MNPALIVFWIVAAVSVISALGVVLHPNPVRSALLLVVNFVALAVCYLMLNAPVMAVLQILVYAGAIMVLFIFVIMLLNLGGELAKTDPLGWQQRLLGAVLGIALAAAVGWGIAANSGTGTIMTAGAERVRQAEAQGIAQVQVLGWDLFARYVYPFELTSVLLLVGAIGVITLTKRRADAEAGRGSHS